MHILSAQAPGGPSMAVLPVLMVAVGFTTAFALGVFRRRGIAGPHRLEPDESLEPLTFATFGGFAAWWFTSAAALRVMERHKDSAAVQILPAMLIPLVTAAVILVLIGLLYRNPARLGITPGRIPSGLAKGALAMLIVLPLMGISLVVTEGLWRVLHLEGQYVHNALKLLSNTPDARLKAAICLSILVISPVSEEIFFRGCVQTLVSGWLSRWAGDRFTPAVRWGAVIFAGLFFASAHPWWSMPPIFILALCLGYAYERTGNLWTSITIHALFNAAELFLFVKSAA